MAKKIIRTGTTADPTGDSLKNAFTKVNDNFTELYNALGLDAETLNLGAFEFTGSVITTTDSSAIVIDQATTVTSNLSVGGDLLPQTALGGDLGSSTLPWRSLYVSGSTIYIGGNPLSINNQGELTFNNNRVAHENGEFMTLDNLSDLNVNSPNAGDTIAWAGYQWVNVPLTQDRLADDGDEVVLVGGANPYVTFPAITGGDQLIIQGAEVSTVSGSLALTSQDNLNIIANGSGTAPGGSKNWTFSADGSLTIPGDIRSDSNINIEINLADSTLRRWQFGEDGALTFPDGSMALTDSVLNNGLNADLKGSVFADDSTILVDGEAGKIVGEVNNNNVYTNFILPQDGISQVQIGDGNNAGGKGVVLTTQYVRIFAAVPTTSIGFSGDMIGSVAFDSTYMYYCTANYDGVTNIWKRTAHGAGTW
jgi:hypothetical protein